MRSFQTFLACQFCQIYFCYPCADGGWVLICVDWCSCLTSSSVSTGMGDHVGVQLPLLEFILVINQPIGSTQPGHPYTGGTGDGAPATTREENSKFCVTVGAVTRTAGIQRRWLLIKPAIRLTRVIFWLKTGFTLVGSKFRKVLQLNIDYLSEVFWLCICIYRFQLYNWFCWLLNIHDVSTYHRLSASILSLLNISKHIRRLLRILTAADRTTHLLMMSSRFVYATY